MSARSPNVLPPVGYLRACFDYDPESGELTWKSRPYKHFPSTVAGRAFNRRFGGHVAGSLDVLGYRNISLSFWGTKRLLGCHRIAWALGTGLWSEYEIDHINGDPSDNRLLNLRAGTHADNMQNRKLHRDNTSGFPGVWWSKCAVKWEAGIRASGRKHHLGLFPTPEAAYAAYLEAKARLHKFQPFPRAA